MSGLRSWTGREFHKRGPAAAKFCRCNCGVFETGACPDSDWRTKHATLNLTTSQLIAKHWWSLLQCGSTKPSTLRGMVNESQLCRHHMLQWHKLNSSSLNTGVISTREFLRWVLRKQRSHRSISCQSIDEKVSEISTIVKCVTGSLRRRYGWPCY